MSPFLVSFNHLKRRVTSLASWQPNYHKKKKRLNFLFICYIILDIKGFKSVRLTKTIIVSYSVYLHFSLHCLSLVLFLVSGLIIMAVGEVFLSAFLQVLFDRLASRKFIDLLR